MMRNVYNVEDVTSLAQTLAIKLFNLTDTTLFLESLKKIALDVLSAMQSAQLKEQLQ